MRMRKKRAEFFNLYDTTTAILMSSDTPLSFLDNFGLVKSLKRLPWAQSCDECYYVSWYDCSDWGRLQNIWPVSDLGPHTVWKWTNSELKRSDSMWFVPFTLSWQNKYHTWATFACCLIEALETHLQKIYSWSFFTIS